jgi:hypothetical protein
MPPKLSILKQLSASSAAGSAGSKPFVKLTAKNVLTYVAVGMGAVSLPSKPSYSAPAQKIWNSFTSSGNNNKLATASYSTKSASVVQSSAAESNIIARANYNQTAQTPKMNTGLSNTTGIATSIHKY